MDVVITSYKKSELNKNMTNLPLSLGRCYARRYSFELVEISTRQNIYPLGEGFVESKTMKVGAPCYL